MSILDSMFVLGAPTAEKIARAALIYVFLIVALRLAGKRELAQLSTIDFVVLLAVANAVQNGIIGNDSSVTGAVLGATTLFVLNAALARLLYRSGRARRLVDGTGTVVIAEGRVDDDALRREQLSPADLLLAVQRQGADDLADVERCVLAPGGAIIVTKKADSRELTAITALSADVAALRSAVSALGSGPA